MGSGSPKENNSYTGHSAMSESIIDILYNSVTKIKINSIYGTGFFMKININGKMVNCLLTCSHIISQNDIISKNYIDLYYDKRDKEHKRIKLDKNIRYIKSFEDKKDITIIEIIESDEIKEDKYLSPDLNYKTGYEKYKNSRICSAGYPIDKNKNFLERHVSSGEINKINDFEFEHNSDSNLGSSGSPICLIENQLVIGIHKQGDKKNKANFGTFIGIILDELEKEIIKDNKSGKENLKHKFCFFDDNKSKYIEHIKKLINNFHRQNEDNYYFAFGDLDNYLSNINDIELRNDFSDILKNFINCDDYRKMLKNFVEEGFIKKINNLIRTDNNELLEKLYYFIGGFLYNLEKVDCRITTENKFFRGDKMTYNQLVKYKNNLNKILFYKGFCSASKLRPVAAMYARTHGNQELYSVIIEINYIFKKNWKPYCFDISKFSKFEETQKVLFTLHTCFKIRKVNIQEIEKKAEIIFDGIGIKVDKNLTEVNDITFIEKDNVLQVI